MMVSEKFATFLSLFSQCKDRFCTLGYHEPLSLEEQLNLASKVNGLRGVELDYPSEVNWENVEKVRSLTQTLNLEVVGVEVDIFSDPKWMKGSYTNPDETLRNEAVRFTKEAMDIAKVLCKYPQISIWPGQDGYDYPFQTDYRGSWNQMVKALQECAEYNKNIKICIEYKIKEPRTHIFLGTVGKALLLVNQVGLDNVGVVLDVGHALMAFENIAESAVLLDSFKKLFHIHINDNYREWDHDLIPGTIHFWEFLEFFFWLKEINYNGWFTLDMFPYREDPIKAGELAIINMKKLMQMADKIDAHNLKSSIRERDFTKAFSSLQERILV